MKKTFSILILLSSLLNAEVYYKNKNNLYNDREADYLKNDNKGNYKNTDDIYISGYVVRVQRWNDYHMVTIKDKNLGMITVKTGTNEGFNDNDIVVGRCINKNGSYYERCSLNRR